MTIQTTVSRDQQLTVHTAQGELIFAEVMTTLRAFYGNEPTLNVLWDIREAIVTTLTADQMRTAVHFAAQYDATRPNGKTALPVSSRLGDYGRARMIEILGKVERVQVAIMIFRDYEEARQWLMAEV